MVNGHAQGLHTERGLGGIQVGQEILRNKRCADARVVVATRIGNAEIDIGRFAQIPVCPDMTDNTEILTLKGLKYIVGITAVNLGRSLEEPVFRRGKKTRKGNAGIVNAVSAAPASVG